MTSLSFDFLPEVLALRRKWLQAVPGVMGGLLDTNGPICLFSLQLTLIAADTAVLEETTEWRKHLSQELLFAKYL